MFRKMLFSAHKNKAFCIPVSLAVVVVETLFFDAEYEPMITFTEMLAAA